MPPIQLTYGNAALAWGRDQARSAKALATEGERSVMRVLPSAERGATASASGSRASLPSGAASTMAATASAPTPGVAGNTASAGNRFARLLADIADAQLDTVDTEVAAQDAPPSGSTPNTGSAVNTSLAVALRAAADRARLLMANAPQQTALAASLAATEAPTGQRADRVAERRTQLEDRARRIGLQAKRQPAFVSMQLSLSYDQVAYVAPPKATIDRSG